MVLSKILANRSPNLTVRWLSSTSAGKHVPNPDMWRKVFIFLCIPAIGLAALNAYLSEAEHFEHRKPPEAKHYEYLNRVRSPFPWGDGQHGLFFNPKVNPCPHQYTESKRCPKCAEVVDKKMH